MANFCTQCGRPLKDGEICICQQKKAEHQSGQEIPAPGTVQAAGTSARKDDVTPDAPQIKEEQTAGNTFAAQEVQTADASQQAATEGSQTADTTRQAATEGSQTADTTRQTATEGNQTADAAQQKTMTKEAEWLHKTKNSIVKNTKNVFAEIGPILKHPTVTAKKLAEGGNSAIGLELIISKAVLSIIVVLIILGRIGNVLKGFSGGFFGGSGNYTVRLPWFRAIFAALLLTVAADFLSVLLLKVVSGLFNAQTTFKAMINVVGERSLYDIIVLILVLIGAIISPMFGLILAAVGMTCLVAVEYNAYSAVVDVAQDKELYIYMICKAIVTVICLLLAYFMLAGAVQSLIGSLGGMLMNSIF